MLTAQGISETHRLCSGGGQRASESVRNGIAALGPCDYIAVHDGVRPLRHGTPHPYMRRNGGTVRDGRPRHTPRRFVPEGRCDDGGRAEPVDRETLRAVQTPQVFRADLLRRAYKADYRPEFTDDASVVEANGANGNALRGRTHQHQDNLARRHSS